VIIGNTAVGQLVAPNADGSFSRGLVWPGTDPLVTQLFGLYVCLDTARPDFLSFGFSGEVTLANGDTLATGLVFDVDTDVPERDHDFTVDFEGLPQATAGTVELWSTTLGGKRLPFAGNFRRAVLAQIPGHTGTPVAVQSALPTGATTVLVTYGDTNVPGESVWVVKSPAAGDATTFAPSDAPRIGGLTPATRPADVTTTAPVIRWDPVTGADLIHVSNFQTGASFTRHSALLPGDATELDLAGHYALSTAPSNADELIVDVEAFSVEGLTVDDDVDGTGRRLSVAGFGRLPLMDRVGIGRMRVSWAP
jgi:hypothetical protein